MMINNLDAIRGLRSLNCKGRIAVFAMQICFALFVYSGLGAAENVKDIVKKLRDKYEKIQTLEADFVQTSIWSLAGETHRSNGKIYIAGGNRYRVETDLQTIVTDGKTVWTYSRDSRQVLIDNLSHSRENPLPRDVLLKYTKDADAELLGETKIAGVTCYKLKFVPKDQESYIVATTVWVDKKSWLAVQIEQEDFNENVTRYELSDIHLNETLPDTLFTFSVPEGVEVVDLR